MKKTVHEWFEAQESPLKELLLANMTSPMKEAHDFKTALNNGFTWAESFEGQDAWSLAYSKGDFSKVFEMSNSRLEFILQITRTNGYDFHLVLPPYKSIRYNAAPFENCQNFSISSFQVLLTQTEDQIKKTLVFLMNRSSKRMLIVDVKKDVLTKIQQSFLNKYILFTTPYLSTNGSDMAIVMFKFPTTHEF